MIKIKSILLLFFFLFVSDNADAIVLLTTNQTFDSIPREQASFIPSNELNQESISGLNNYIPNELSWKSMQSIDSNKSKSIDMFKYQDNYVPDTLFRYADTKRYTITGEKPLERTMVRPITAGLLFSSYAVIFYVQHMMQQNTIWKQVGNFNFKEDAKFTLYLDKAGHFYGTYLTSYVFSEAFLTAGFSWDMSTIIGGILGLCYTGYVEVLDGYSVGFGFSPSDFYADIAGAGYYIAQHYFPYLQNFTPKFQYAKPIWHNELDRMPHDAFIDNYSCQIFWLSANIHNMLPENLKKYWPSWLELSFGYSVYSLFDPSLRIYPDQYSEYIKKSEHRNLDVWGNQKFIIGLDYNLVKLIPESWNFLNWLRQTANFFKLPAPAIEIGTHSTKFYLFYPIEIKFGSISF